MIDINVDDSSEISMQYCTFQSNFYGNSNLISANNSTFTLMLFLFFSFFLFLSLSFSLSFSLFLFSFSFENNNPTDEVFLNTILEIPQSFFLINVPLTLSTRILTTILPMPQKVILVYKYIFIEIFVYRYKYSKRYSFIFLL